MKIPLFRIFWDSQDINAIKSVIKKGMYWTCGLKIKEFEEKLAEYVGTKYSVVFNSGTSALHAVLIAHNIRNGDEVIVPSFTFIATANAPLFVGAKPIFADIERKTFGLDPEDVKEKITSKTKAILPIHYGGSPCLIRELKEIAEDHNLILIEDAAEALGAKIGNKKVGTFGNSAIFSFCQNKIITTGEGGAVVTDSKEVYEKLKLIRSHGRVENTDYFSSWEYAEYVMLGYNYRMPEILAALGIAQLNKIERLIEMRRKNAQYLNKNLSHLKEISVPKPIQDCYFNVYQMYTILLKGDENLRDGLAKYLRKKNIATKVYFYPVHKTYFYKKILNVQYNLPSTEELSKQVLSLPMYPSLKKEEMNYIANEISNFLNKVRYQN